MIFYNDSENGYTFHIPPDEGKDFCEETCGAIFASTPPPVEKDVPERSVDLVTAEEFSYRIVITLSAKD